MSDLQEAIIDEPNVSTSLRTFEEVDNVFEDAHVEPGSLKPVYQALWFAEQQPLEENLFLLELDKKLMSALKEGQSECSDYLCPLWKCYSLVLRGDKDERAVLCTDNQTFNLQVAEISNSLALVPDIVWSSNANGSSEKRVIENKKVHKIFFEYFEVQPTSPRITKLLSLLEPSCYKGPKHEEVYKKEGVELKSTRDLLMTVQASEAELLQALKDNCVCYLKGHWRLLDRDYHYQILSHVLKVIASKSWALDGIIKEHTINALQEEFPEEAVEVFDHLLEWYCETTDVVHEGGETKLILRADRVCRFLGEMLLRLSAKFNLEEFLIAWQDTVPRGMKIDLKYLEGIALKDDQSKPPSIYFFPEWELPEDIGERFKVLFMTKPKWFLEEITPYLQNLTTERMNVNALLTKHALGSNVNGKRCYSARHGK